MTATPLVSVVMPVHNCERFLSLAVESILCQTFTDFELVAIDDGSTDQSLAILNRHADVDPRVRVFSRSNTGIVAALNDGLAMARGQFVARMDGDDIAMADRFERQVDFLRQHPDHVLVGSQVLLIDRDGLPIRPMHGIPLSHEEIDQDHLAAHWPLVHPTVMMRRDLVIELGGYRRSYQWIEDMDLFLRLAEIGRLANLPQILLDYRQHAASICQTRTQEQSRLKKTLLAETRLRRGLPPSDASLASIPSESLPLHRHQLWAWWALQAGNVATARKHALKTLREAPLSGESWKLFACAIRGR